jgi:hypothetical protein
MPQERSSERHRWRSLSAWTLAIVCIVLVVSQPSFAKETSGEGYVLVPSLLTSADRNRYPGFFPPSIWIYDDKGTALPSEARLGAYNVGQKIPLPQGWYLVEVGTVQAPENRLRLYVSAGKTTVVPTGLVVVSVEHIRQQPRDVCNPWTGKLFVSLPIDPKPGPTVSTNRRAGNFPVGVLQVPAGYYRIQWNRFYIATDVKAYMAFNLETGLIGPMPQQKYQVHRQKGHTAHNPGLRLCRNRPTRVLVRSYWGTYNRQISAYPFKQRIWEQLTVEAVKSKRGPYQKLKKPRIRGAIYKGPGSEPVAMWEEEDQDLPPAGADSATPGDTPTQATP